MISASLVASEASAAHGVVIPIGVAQMSDVAAAVQSCRTCHQTKPLSAFGQSRGHARRRCLDCARARRRARAEAERTGTACPCGGALAGPYATRCAACLARVRKRPARQRLTTERETYLRAHYTPHERGSVTRIASALGVSRWQVRAWVAALGLGVPVTAAPWTPADVAFLETHVGSRSVAWIARKLGRTGNAVALKARQLAISLRDARDWYTADGVALAMGVDVHTVTRWIRLGYLQAGVTERRDGRPVLFSITPAAIRKFLQSHPTAYRLAKVDQVWFLDLAFGGIGTPPAPRPEPQEADAA